MVIQLNGERRELAPATTIAELVTSLGWLPEQVAVEQNGRVVRRAEYAARTLAPGDAVEIVTLVGGG
ncbi:MAG: sulfur carrier protein ThiS [Planctomycetes bacterium]|nr:sulfur carrier protein ThiS [Planctomycetota bacterium]